MTAARLLAAAVLRAADYLLAPRRALAAPHNPHVTGCCGAPTPATCPVRCR